MPHNIKGINREKKKKGGGQKEEKNILYPIRLVQVSQMKILEKIINYFNTVVLGCKV